MARTADRTLNLGAVGTSTVTFIIANQTTDICLHTWN